MGPERGGERGNEGGREGGREGEGRVKKGIGVREWEGRKRRSVTHCSIQYTLNVSNALCLTFQVACHGKNGPVKKLVRGTIFHGNFSPPPPDQNL